MDFKHSWGTHSRVLFLSPGIPKVGGAPGVSQLERIDGISHCSAPPSGEREDFSQMGPLEIGFQKKGYGLGK